MDDGVQLFGDLVAVLADPTSTGFTAALNRVSSWMAGTRARASLCSPPIRL